MALKLYNTLSRKKEVFKPIKKNLVGMYTCGPTVYGYAHIGNMRTYVFSDILKRVLKFNGFNVKHVMNVTDVGHLTSDADSGEDKIEAAAKKEGRRAEEIAEFYFGIFKEDMDKLNIVFPDIWSKATEHIKEQIDLIKKLEKKKLTYKTGDGIYFDSSKDKKYGRVGRINMAGVKGGKRVGMGGKKRKTDFALWKFSQGAKRQQEWDSPWGVGFPGWHIECSAMAMKYLGKSFDIHTGGEDLAQIHHTNEIAQSEGATGKKFVNYWLHGAFLLSKGSKVSRSTGGLYTVSDLEKIGYDALDFRYLNLMTHYRKPLNFTLDNLDAARKTLGRIRRRVIELRSDERKGMDASKGYLKRFEDAVSDDLNMPQALNVLWGVLDDFDFDPGRKVRLLEKFDKVLGLGFSGMIKEEVKVSEEVRRLIAKREKLRKEKKWAEADVVRERIREKGFMVEDKGDGTRLERV